MKNMVEYLKNNITEKMPLDEIISAFEQMCQIPAEDDAVLFETGTFSFTGKPLFYFSMVRQLPGEDDEYLQIHVNVLYKPTQENKALNGTEWSDCIDENIFDYIRSSQAFACVKDSEYVKVEIFADET